MAAESEEPRRGTTDHMAGSDHTRRGYLTGPGLFEHPVEYAVVDGVAIYDGCIDMGPADEVATDAAQIGERRRLAATSFAGDEAGSTMADVVLQGVGLPGDSAFLWPGGLVPYDVDAGVPDVRRIDDAIAHIEENTGIRFVRRNPANAATYPNYVDIISNGNAGWSSSAIGCRGDGRQLVRLADGHPWAVLVHEFLHALGVYHEQSRSDRDTFVDIKWDNIQDGPPPVGEINALGNFQKQPGATDYYDYDYGSIMHYHGRSFAKDPSKPTIVPRQAGVTIGQRSGLSFGDRQTLAKQYERFFTKGYTGVWRAGAGRYGLWVNAEWTDFRSKWEEWSALGLRLVDIHVRQTRSGPRYSGVFLPGAGRYGLWANVTWDDFRSKWEQWSGQGLRLHDVHVHHVNGENRYSGVFLEGTGGYALWANVSWDSFRTKWQEWSGQGLRLHDLHVHHVNGENRYSGVFLPGAGGYGLWVNANWEGFVAKWREWSAQGLRLADVNLHFDGGNTRYSAVFQPGTDAYYLWANVTWESFRAKWQELAGRGLRLIDFELPNPEAGAVFDGGLADAAAAGLDEEPQPFGGIFEAVMAEAEPAGQPVDGGGGLREGEPVPAGRAASGSGGGAELASPGSGLGADVDASGSGPGGEADSGGVYLPDGVDAERGTPMSGMGAAELP